MTPEPPQRAPQIVLCLPATQEPGSWLAALHVALPEAAVTLRPADRPVDPAAVQADFAICYEPSAALFEEQRALRAVFTLSAGVNVYLKAAHLLRGVPLIRLEDAGMAMPMAQYVLAAALRFTLRLDLYRSQQQQVLWRQWPVRGPGDMQTGVLGLGAIGRPVAETLAAQGFRVRGFSRSAKRIPQVLCMDDSLPGAFDAFLTGLDLLVSVLPLTSGNRNLLDRAALSRLNDGAHLINVGRGPHLVDEDLLALLDGGKLSGATLDVFRGEPLPAEHPFWRRPEIALTPHVSGVTPVDASIRQIACKIRCLMRGEAVGGVVDLARGY